MPRHQPIRPNIGTDNTILWLTANEVREIVFLRTGERPSLSTVYNWRSHGYLHTRPTGNARYSRLSLETLLSERLNPTHTAKQKS